MIRLAYVSAEFRIRYLFHIRIPKDDKCDIYKKSRGQQLRLLF